MTTDWNSGFRAGVAAMRERAAQCCESQANPHNYIDAPNTTREMVATNCATLIRHYLPGPGEEHGPIGPISYQEPSHA